MNRLTIIGNLTRDPELRSTQQGVAVCGFTVAVNRQKSGAEAGKQEADFFRVTTWRQTAENCQRYLAKGSKVAVVGSVSVNTYTGQDGQQRANLEVNAQEVEFLSSPLTREAVQASAPAQVPPGFVQVDDELPF